MGGVILPAEHDGCKMRRPSSLNVILTMNHKNILETKGKIKMELARRKARGEYEKYKKTLKEQERLNSIKELDEDLKKLKKKRPPKS